MKAPNLEGGVSLRPLCPAAGSRRGPGLQGERCAEMGSIVPGAGLGEAAHALGENQRHLRQRPRRERSGNPSRTSPRRCVRNRRFPGAGGKGASPPPRHLPPSRTSPHWPRSKGSERALRRQAVAYPPSTRPAFLGKRQPPPAAQLYKMAAALCLPPLGPAVSIRPTGDRDRGRRLPPRPPK